jgi:anti-anti-sigma regulatory factor
MNITVDRVQGALPVAVVRLEGDLDASNFEALIDEARRLHGEGTRHIVLDMTGVPYMGSSGLVALHAIATLLEGGEPPDLESGWQAHHAIGQSVEAGMQEHLKVVLGDPPVAALLRVFQRTGMDRFIEIHTTEAAAVASF